MAGSRPPIWRAGGGNLIRISILELRHSGKRECIFERIQNQHSKCAIRLILDEPSNSEDKPE